MLGLKLVLGFLVFVSSAAIAETSKLSCFSGSEMGTDTGYSLVENADNFLLRVWYGPGAIPIEADPSTTVRVRDLKRLSQRAAIFSKLPERFELKFPKNQCEFRSLNGQLNWHCFIREPGQLGTLKYQSLSFFMFTQKVESIYSINQWFNVGLEFRIPIENSLDSILRTAVVTFENTTDVKVCRVD